MTTPIQVVIDCADPAALSTFWADVLHYLLQPPPDGYDSWQAALTDWGVPESDWNSASAIVDPDGVGPRIYFQRVPEAKAVKNRLHLDVGASGGRAVPIEERKVQVDSEVARLIELGARRLESVEELGGYHVVMQDPESNEFCVH